MKFNKEFLQKMCGETILITIIEHGNLTVTYERIFKYEGRFYKTQYKIGATERQDAVAYEYDKDEIECVEVMPVEKMVIVYEEVKNE